MTTFPIRVSAVALTDPRGRLLCVRKRGTERFMCVGGKPEPGETPRAAAVRETAEEIGVSLAVSDLTLLGRWRAPAANEAGHDVIGVIFVATTPLEVSPPPCAEIAEIRWLDPRLGLPDDLAPLLRDRVIPALTKAGYVDLPGCPDAGSWELEGLPHGLYGDPSHHDRLVTLIASGTKRATSSLVADYHAANKPLPQVGHLEVLSTSDGQLLGLTESIDVEIRALSEVSQSFAAAEGEDWTSAAAWRHAHESFWGRGPLPDDTQVVCERLAFLPAPDSPS